MRIRRGLDNFYNREYLKIKAQRESEVEPSERPRKARKEISDKDVLSRMPRSVVKLSQFIDQVDKLRHSSEVWDTEEE